MPIRSYPSTLGCRVNDREQARVDAAARLKNLTRAEYVRAAVLPQAERDIRNEVAMTDEAAALGNPK